MRNPAECEVANGLGLKGWGVGVSGNSSGSKQHFAARGAWEQDERWRKRNPIFAGDVHNVPTFQSSLYLNRLGFFSFGPLSSDVAMFYLSPTRTRVVQGHVIPISILFI